MQLIKRMVTSLVIIPPTAYLLYLLTNLILAFGLEFIRVYQKYEVSENADVFKGFSLHVRDAFNYQSEYQLYYIVAGVLGIAGLIKMVFYVFTEMYVLKRRKRTREEINRDTQERNLLESPKDEDEPKVKEIYVTKEVQKDNTEMLEQILQAVTMSKPIEKKEHVIQMDGRNSHAEYDYNRDHEGSYGEFKIMSKSPDDVIASAVKGNGEEPNSDYKD